MSADAAAVEIDGVVGEVVDVMVSDTTDLDCIIGIVGETHVDAGQDASKAGEQIVAQAANDLGCASCGLCDEDGSLHDDVLLAVVLRLKWE